MNLHTLKKSFTRMLPAEQENLLKRIRANRTYPTGRMCNYTSWILQPTILQGNSPDESQPLDSTESPDEVEHLSPLPATSAEGGHDCGADAGGAS